MRAAWEKLRERAAAAFGDAPEGFDSPEGARVLSDLIAQVRNEPTEVIRAVGRASVPGRHEADDVAEDIGYVPRRDGTQTRVHPEYLIRYPSLWRAGYWRNLATWRELLARAPWGFMRDLETPTDDPR